MITINFEEQKNSGLCESIYNSIKEQIIQGKLKSMEKLPSKRALAQNLGVSVITVQNAYAQLISEGYIYSIEKKGFFVTDLPLLNRNRFSATLSSASADENLTSSHHDSSNENQHLTSQNDSLNPQDSCASSEAVRSKNTWFADFKNNSISYEKFPFSLWSHTMRQILNSGDEKLLQRSQAKGVPELRAALSRYLQDFRNMNVNPEQIVIGAGTENLYAIIVQLLGREKIYAVENPGYHKAEAVFRLNGVKTVPVNLDREGISITELENSAAQVLHFSPSHHFPTGIVMPVRRRQEILSWAVSEPNSGPLSEMSRSSGSFLAHANPSDNSTKGRFILEDDYDSEFRFNGKPLPTLQSADTNDRVIYINTFSKTLAPSFRISYMVLPPSLVPVFEQKIGFYSCPVSSFEQYTLAGFIEQGHFEKHIIRMKNYYRNLRNNLVGAIQNSTLSKITKIQEKEAGLHFLLQVESDTPRNKLIENLEKNGINLPPLSEYYYGTAPEDIEKTFVVNYSGIKRENIAETVRRLEAALL